jgi:excinuclease ABC subunit B
MPLEVHSPYTPKGDQPQAIKSIVEGVKDGLRFQTLLGATGTGKTFTVGKVIEELQRPALILAPNKVLTAQLAGEFREFFPTAAVEFFISYYDYYQPEAYVPAKDLFIEKDANINQELERLRHSTTRSLLTRKDVIVVASVSAIYGLGSPVEYQNLNLILTVGGKITRDDILTRLITQQYERNDIELAPGRFRAKGDVVEIWASYDTAPLRIEMWGDDIDKLVMVDPVTGSELQTLESTTIFPAKHYVTPYEKMEPALQQIEHDLQERLEFFEQSGKLLEKQRLKERTMYDLEMMRTLGYCSGIENYSRYLDGRQPGEPPNTLIDFFPEDLLVFMDESHVMVSQIKGMYNGDRARKQVLASGCLPLWITAHSNKMNFSSASGRSCLCLPHPPNRNSSGQITSPSKSFARQVWLTHKLLLNRVVGKLMIYCSPSANAPTEKSGCSSPHSPRKCLKT